MKSTAPMKIFLTIVLFSRTSFCSESCIFTITTSLLNHTPNGIETIQEINVKKLKIVNGNLPLITRNTFKQYKNLEILVVVNSKLTHIERGSFNGLANLKEMDLRNNLLQSFTTNVFPKNNCLEKLILSGNILKNFRGPRFNKISELDVSSNNLEYLPKSIRRIKRSLKIIAGNNPFWECANGSYSEDGEFRKKFCTRKIKIDEKAPVAMMDVVEAGDDYDSGCNFMLCMYWMIGAVPVGIVIGNTWAMIKCFQRCCCRRKTKRTRDVGVQYDKVEYVIPPRLY